MASLIPGYEYDIFISYRQKDNKYDGWVTEFVDNLKRELESTFKEDVSVYFDINPHDGLLETHDVDASLKEKLKCLVFIPIISRTYCDPKSFAWEHEFKAFIELASQDQFGLKVKLSSGNITNRVLPVQIHDLNPDDKTIVEREFGGHLRSIEFIYKEPGVNKPLSSEDDEKKNLNNTKYRIQINKVANTIDEIISGLRNFQKTPAKREVLQSIQHEEVIKEQLQIKHEKSANKNKFKIFSAIAILIILIISSILAYPKIFPQSKLRKVRSSDEKISIAVMPFKNMTHDTIWNDWQNGIQTSLINSLSNSEEFKVCQIEPVKGLIQSKELTDYASITPSLASSISKTLDADFVICGNINRAGATTRLSAQLIDSKSEEIFKTFEINEPSGEEMILKMIDSLRKSIKDYLIITILKKEVMPDISPYVVTNYPSALKYYSRGEDAFYNRDYGAAIKSFSLSYEADSNMASAIFYLSLSYYQIGRFKDAKKWYNKLEIRKEPMSFPMECWTGWLKGAIYGQPYEGIKSLRQLQKIDNQSPLLYYSLGHNYNILHQFNEAIPESEKALEIYKKWGSKPAWVWNYAGLIIAYHSTAQYKKEKKMITLAEQDFPDDPEIISRQAILALTEKDTIAANQYIEKYKSIIRGDSESEAKIIKDIAQFYSEAGIPDRAEKYYRQALSFDPEDPDLINDFANFLISKNRNIDEGLQLADKSLRLKPDNNYQSLHTIGWGLFKQGKFQEAQEKLQKSWDLRIDIAGDYDYYAYSHLEAAIKAAAGQK